MLIGVNGMGITVNIDDDIIDIINIVDGVESLGQKVLLTSNDTTVRVDENLLYVEKNNGDIIAIRCLNNDFTICIHGNLTFSDRNVYNNHVRNDYIVLTIVISLSILITGIIIKNILI